MSIPFGGLRTLLLSPLVRDSIATVRFAMVESCRDERSVWIITPGVVRECVPPELWAALARCFSRLIPRLLGADDVLQRSELPVWDWSRSAPLVLVRTDLAMRGSDRNNDISVGEIRFEEVLTAA